MRLAVIRLTCCLVVRACISAASCHQAVLLPNGDVLVRVRPVVLGLTFCIMVIGCMSSAISP